MFAVKPPEWDALSANEQLLWYLKRLCAKAEEMSSLLGVASAGDPPVVTPIVDPAASTTTHASSAPDVSGSTTKVQEVLEVIHDAPPACVAMAPVTCLTDGSNQVIASTNVNEVRDAATIVYPEPAVDLDNKEVEHLTPAPATSSIGSDTYSITKEVVPSMAITTDIDPKAGVQEFDALSVNTTPVTSEADHSAILLISSDPAAPTLTRCSTNSRRDSNQLRYALHSTATPSWLVLRPKAWPSFWRDHAEETEVRPIPWPSFSLGRFLEHPYMSIQLHGIGFNISSIPRKLFHIGELVCDTWERWYNLSGHSIRIFPGLFLCLWSLKQDNEDSEFNKHVKLFHGSHGLVELCACASTIAPILHQSCLATLAVHLFWNLKKLGVLSTKLASSIYLQLRRFELLPSSRQSSHEVHAQYWMVPWDSGGHMPELCSSEKWWTAPLYCYERLQWPLMTLACAPQIRLGAWAQILNEPQVFECASLVASSCCCFFLATCAPCFRVQPQASFSASSGVLISQLAQQQHHNSSVVSIFDLLLHILQQTCCPTFTPADICMEKNSQNIVMLPCNLLLDRCLKSHMVHRETDSKMMQSSRIHCVQSECYFEVGLAQENLKLNEVSAVVVDCEILLCCKHPPDPTAPFLHEPQLLGCTSSIATDFIWRVPYAYCSCYVLQSGYMSTVVCDAIPYKLATFLHPLLDISQLQPDDHNNRRHLLPALKQWQLSFYEHPWQYVVFGLLYEVICCGEASPYGGNLEILRLLAARTVQFATELMDSARCLFTSIAFHSGHKQRFLWTPNTAKISVFHQRLLAGFQKVAFRLNDPSLFDTMNFDTSVICAAPSTSNVRACIFVPASWSGKCPMDMSSSTTNYCCYFSCGTRPDACLTVALDWLGYRINELLQEEMSWDPGGLNLKSRACEYHVLFLGSLIAPCICSCCYDNATLL